MSAPETFAGAPTDRVIEAPEYAAAGLEGRALLAIDTSLGTSVALGVDARMDSGVAQILESVSDDPRGHAELIGTLIARVFERSGATPADVAAVVVGVGPGPFTGLRVGIAAAHAFAVGQGVPLLPLHGHEAVALATLEAGAAPALRVVQDARRRELFVTDYSGLDWRGVPVRVADPHLVVRASYVPAEHEVWPERIPPARLIQLALRRLASMGGIAGPGAMSPEKAAELERAFEPDRAMYLRSPDVKAPVAPKRVTP